MLSVHARQCRQWIRLIEATVTFVLILLLVIKVQKDGHPSSDSRVNLRSIQNNGQLTPSGETSSASLARSSLSQKTYPSKAELDGMEVLNLCLENTLHGNRGDVQAIRFACDGPNYDTFGELLHNYITNTTLHHSSWGRRSMEPSIPNGATLLFYGDNQGRQIALAWACQHMASGQVESVRSFSGDATVFKVDFVNQATLYVMTESEAPYDNIWQSSLEAQIEGRALESLDGIIVSFASASLTIPPPVEAWLQAFPGPFLFVSTFDASREKQAQDLKQKILQVQQRRTNVGFLYGRKHVEAIHHEGAFLYVDGVLTAGAAHEGNTSNRCVGSYGGHPDLIAWDVAEWTLANVNAVVHKTGEQPAFSRGEDKGTSVDITQKTKQEGEGDDDEDPPEALLYDDLNVNRFDMLKGTGAFRRYPVTEICAGPHYDEFGLQLHQYATNQTVHGSTWGRRVDFGIPANKKILFFGNSHTRQIAVALAGQHMAKGNLVSVETYKAIFAGRFVFANQAELYFATNTYVPFSHNWTELLEDLVQTSLSDFDAVVVGFVNGCNDQYSKTMPEEYNVSGIDCSIAPPGITDWLDAFHGPLLFVTPFYLRGQIKQEQWGRELATLKRSSRRSDQIGFVYGRQHIERVGHEGSSCNPTGDVSYWPSPCADGHRCVGQFGGYPDLAAWDVAEWLWEGRDSFNSSGIADPFLKRIRVL